MTSPTRLLVPLWAAIAIAAPAASSGGPLAQRNENVSASPNAPTALERFRGAMDAWREGSAPDTELVRRQLLEYAALANRPDLNALVAAYGRITPEERTRGFELEREVLGLRAKFGAAGQSRMQGDDRPTEQTALEEALEDAWRRTRGLADLGARAQASALRAELRIARVEFNRDREIDPELEAMLDAAEQDARDAITDFEAFGIVQGRLNPLHSLARIQRFWGRIESARQTYEMLQNLAASVGNVSEERRAYLGLLSLARETGDVLESDRCIMALAKLRRGTLDWELTREWCMQRLHEDRADEAARRLEEFRKLDPSWPRVASERREHQYVLALLHLRMGDLRAAREASREAAVVAARAGTSGVGAAFQQAYLEARIELASGNPARTISMMEPFAVSGNLRARDEGAALALLGQARLENGDARGAVAELERVLEVAESQRRRLSAESMRETETAQPLNVLGEWEGAGLETVALLARAKLQLNDPIGAALVCEDWQSRTLRSAVGRRLNAPGGNPDAPLTRDTLSNWTREANLGLITWVFGADSGAVIHVRRGPDGELDAEGAELNFGRGSLMRAVSRVREELRRGDTDSDAGASLVRHLVPEAVASRLGAGPLVASTAPDGDDRLLLLLHGPLEALPLEVLPILDGARALDAHVIVLPGLPHRSPGDQPRREAFRTWTLMGDPLVTGSGGESRRKLLPSAEAELSRISAVWGTVNASRTARFGRADMVNALRGTRCLHIATHLQGTAVESNSRFSPYGLRLDDGGVFTAAEIAAIAPQLPLVVLSACETGGGRYVDAEGLLGLSRAFLESGTRNLVVTLWPVADGAACAFSVEFHVALQEGSSPSEAVERARQALRAGGRSPGDWAAFRFMGQD